MGLCMSIDENTLQARKERKRIIMEVMNAEARAFQLLCQMPGRTCANGATTASCLFTKQGRKGINQDCMLVWEEFAALSNTALCAIFDGHGPKGHLVARKVRDSLPLLLALPLDSLSNVEVYPVRDGWNKITAAHEDDRNKEPMEGSTISEREILEPSREETNRSTISDPDALETWEKKIVAAYEIMDQNLKTHPKLNSFCSGTTAIAVVVQDKHLVVGNVGDSRALIARRSGDCSLVADQLTVDLKPTLPGELERIRRCNGRVFALEDEPGVARVWQPHIDMPGLAMARALGDFCLKDYGLSARPEVSYRSLTAEDEFLVLATDGVWDVLSNDDVLVIVSSAFPKETAAKCVVDAAVKQWKRKHAAARMDDCTVVCYFLKQSVTTIRSVSEPDGQASMMECSLVDEGDDNLDMDLDQLVEEDNAGLVSYDTILTGNDIDAQTIVAENEADFTHEHLERGV